MRKIRACVRAVRCSLCMHQVATPTGQNCPIEKDFMIQRSSKSLKQTCARCKPRIVKPQTNQLQIKGTSPQMWRRTNYLGQDLRPDITLVREHNHVPEDLPNVSASSQKTRAAKSFEKNTFANEHLVTVSGTLMARPTSPQGGGYACGCSPG